MASLNQPKSSNRIIVTPNDRVYMVDDEAKSIAEVHMLLDIRHESELDPQGRRNLTVTMSFDVDAIELGAVDELVGTADTVDYEGNRSGKTRFCNRLRYEGSYSSKH